MDPILASGLVSIGKSVAERIIEPGITLGKSIGTSDFSAALNQLDSKALTPAEKVQVTNLKQSLQDLHFQLRENNLLPNGFQPQADSVISLQREANGGFTLTNEQGQNYSIPQGSRLDTLAKDLFSVKEQISQISNQPLPSVIHLAESNII